MKFEDVTKAIIGAAFEVYNTLGYGYLEKVYQKSMQVELLQRGINTELEYAIKIYYKKTMVGDYYADLFVDRKVILELKVAKFYNSRDEAQLLNELKATGVEVGLLINFGLHKLEFKRMVLTR
jgi:GxxExxY protein